MLFGFGDCLNSKQICTCIILAHMQTYRTWLQVSNLKLNNTKGSYSGLVTG